MTDSINNLRIHFYGVQGSGSVFPRQATRDEIREKSDIALLEQVFNKIQNKADQNGKLNCSTEELLDGPINREVLTAYRDRLELAEQTVYGGWTSCFRIETSDGYDIVFDCGSGFRLCAQDLEKKWGDASERQLTIFGSHAHFDHTEGFDQSSVCFDSRNHIQVIANHSYLSSLDQYLGIFSRQADRNQSGRPTPLTYQLMPAKFESTEIRDLSKPSPESDPIVGQYHDLAQPIIIGKTSIQAFEVFHPDPCLAYRVEHNGKVFVYCTDHERRHGSDPSSALQVASDNAEKRLLEHAMNADIMYRDGQFLLAEYNAEKGLGNENLTSRKDWGHSCIEDVVALAEKAQVKNTYIGHHDPNRSWRELTEIDQMLGQLSLNSNLNFELAKAETVIDL